MKIVSDILRGFGITLMLVAILTLTFHAGVAYAAGSGGADDCPDGIAAIQVDQDSKLVPIERGDADHARHNAPCKSTCCGVACSMLTTAAQATGPALAFVEATHDPAVFQGAGGVDLKGLLRPPKGRLPPETVAAGAG